MDNKISFRIEKARIYANISQDRLGKGIGKNRKTIMNYEAGTSEPTVSIVQKIAQITKVNDWWLFTGKGEMIEKEEKNTQNIQQYIFPLIKNKVSAGIGKGQIYKLIIENEIRIDKYLFKTEPDKDILAIQVSGTSMEPTIKDKSFVLFQKSNIFDGENLYIIVKDNELFVKRLYKDMEGNLHIKSDNLLYPEIIIKQESQEYNFILGKVKQVVPMLEF